MATASLFHQTPFHHHHHFHHHRFHTPPHKLSFPPLPAHSSSLAAQTSTTSTSTSLDALAALLSSSDFRRADDETRRLLIALAGEPALKRGYVFFSEVQFVPSRDLRAIDALWRSHSGGRFGYSVQKRIWEKKANRDFTKFFIKVGWMRKLDTEVEQWNYRSFPTEFVWELGDDTPEGHLPLTNALRGTQLLTSVLTHPAFDDGDDGDVEVEVEVEERSDRGEKKLGDFTPDYSF